MKAGDRYFMAVVDLLTVKARIERILESVNTHQQVPSIELMAACIDDLSKAMISTHRDRLSDPRYKITPTCRYPGCHDEGPNPFCKFHAGVVKCHDLGCDECYGYAPGGSVHK